MSVEHAQTKTLLDKRETYAHQNKGHYLQGDQVF